MSSKRKNYEPKLETPWLQWAGSTGATLLLFVSGLMSGWTSPYVAQLTAKDSPLPITLDEASWVASLLTLGRLTGAVPGALCMNYFGGRKTLILIGFPMLISWICTILANSVYWLYAARLLCGTGTGMSFSSFPLFLGEISNSKIRGTLVTFAMFGLTVGILAGNIIGAYVSMATFAYISMVPVITAMIILSCLPDSPHLLIRRGKFEKARVSIAKYNPGINVEAEVKSLTEFISTSDSMSFADRMKEFNIPENRKAGMIICMLYLFMQFSGVNTVVFYMELIMTDGGLSVIKPATMVIIVGVIGNVTAFCGIYIADKCGRKTLMIVSSAGVAFSMLTLGGHFMFLNQGFDPAGLQWLLISSFVIYEVFVFIGVSPVPSMVLSELFAPSIKSIAACFGSISIGLFSFISTKTYQPLIDAIGLDYVFWLYAVIMMLAIIFTVQVMPETKGKTLKEIQDILHKKYVPVNVKHDNYESDKN